MQVLHVVNGLKIAEGQIPPQGSILGPLLTIFCFHKKVRTYIKINLTCVQSNYDVTLLSVIIAYKSVRQAQYKLYALQCIRKFLAVEKAKRLGTTFINSQFNYLQSLWFKLTTIRLGKGGNAVVKVTYASSDCTSLLKRISYVCYNKACYDRSAIIYEAVGFFHQISCVDKVAQFAKFILSGSR